MEAKTPVLGLAGLSRKKEAKKKACLKPSEYSMLTWIDLNYIAWSQRPDNFFQPLPAQSQNYLIFYLVFRAFSPPPSRMIYSGLTSLSWF